MAESDLSITYWDLVREISHFLGAGLNPEGDRLVLIRDIIESGHRQFLMPPVLPGERKPHRWRFLSPAATLALRPSYKETGTIATCSVATVTVTDTAAKFLAYGVEAGDSFVITAGDADAGTYTVASVTSETVLVLTATAGTGTATYTVGAAAWKYPLPDDYGGLILPFRYPAGTSHPPLERTSEGRILAGRSSSNTTGYPRMFAVRPRPFVQASGQRFEIIFWPTPSVDKTLEYTYAVLMNKMGAVLMSHGAGTIGADPYEVLRRYKEAGTTATCTVSTVTVTDTAAHFVAYGVAAGDAFEITAGDADAGTYTVASVTSDTVLVLTATAGSGSATYTVALGGSAFAAGGVVAGDKVILSNPADMGMTQGIFTVESCDADTITFTRGAGAPGQVAYEVMKAGLYPVGGMDHSEAIKFACLAAAEITIKHSVGVMNAKFLERVTASIGIDRSQGAEHLGQNLDASDDDARLSRIASISVGGVEQIRF